MKLRLISLFKTLAAILIMGVSGNALAEYYLVYSVQPVECASCVKVKKVAYGCHHRAIHKRHHYVNYVPHRRSSYSISVYYYGYVAPCCQSCGCVSSCGCNSPAAPVSDFVTFSGQPARYDSYINGTDSNYYQDRRTADDIYPDMNIDN